jgi:hypothetical protein
LTRTAASGGGFSTCCHFCWCCRARPWSQRPATTTISDFVYRADGSLAGGTLLISWPTFSTSTGQSVAAGRKCVTLGPGGVLSVALVPNTSATPSDTFYTVVYQLDDNSTPPKYSRYTTALHLKYPLRKLNYEGPPRRQLGELPASGWRGKTAKGGAGH